MSAPLDQETQYRLLFEGNPFPIWVYDAETLALVAVNDAGLQQYGYSRDEFLRLTLTDLHQKEDAALVLAAVHDLRPLEGRPAGLDSRSIWTHRRKDARLFDVEITSHAVLFAGRPSRLVIANDVTDRLRAQRLKDEIASIVAHDFRSPLQVIRSYAELLLWRTTDEESRRMLSAIESQATHLATVASDTLTMARMETGNFPLHPVPVEVGALVLEIVNARTEELGLRIACEAPEEVVVSADAAQLRQVVDNLIGNAVKYSSSTPKIGVVVRKADDGVEVSVADEGFGILPEEIPKLFHKYSRLDAGRTRGIPGTGLGLYICRLIVEAHGGRIWVESEPGKGSAFRLWLPRGAVPSPAS